LTTSTMPEHSSRPRSATADPLPHPAPPALEQPPYSVVG
jgi:hypothetical protein